MEHFEQPDMGRAEAYVPRKERSCAKPTGWRKATPGVIAANQLAKQGQDTPADKTRSIVAVKRVAAHIGLKAADLLLLDTLAAFTQPQDWGAGARPIVWPSNAFLMAQTGFSLSTLKRHARRLAELGLIAFHDSPNGKRWGRRNADGMIVEAYGFDLSPLGARMEEYEALATEISAERALCKTLRGRITIARRSIRAHLDMLKSQVAQSSVFEKCEAKFLELLACLPGAGASSACLSEVVEKFRGLLAKIEKVLGTARTYSEDSTQTTKLNPTGVISEPHIRITKELNPVNSNSSENEDDLANAGQQTKAAKEGGSLRNAGSTKGKTGIDLAVVMQSCPEFRTWCRSLGGFVETWGDLIKQADVLRPMVGISEHAWAEAQTRMGRPTAAAALALVFEKTHSGEVRSPGGYLRGMVEKSGAGELHLERSFYGRLNATAA